MRFRDVEFRWCKTNNKYELVKWNQPPHEDTCYVLAFFDETKDGYDMRTVGDRFFEDKDAFIVGKHAIEFLNAMFYELQREEELQ
jgi:hypothetical protein